MLVLSSQLKLLYIQGKILGITEFLHVPKKLKNKVITTIPCKLATTTKKKNQEFVSLSTFYSKSSTRRE